MARAVCYRCFRPQVACLCNLCKVVNNRVEVFILQHGRESQHTLGTTRIALLTLAKVRRQIIWRTVDPPASLSSNAALLYPGAQAIDLGQLTDAQQPDQLVVIDGTWPQSRVLLRENGWLQQLPRVSLTPARPGGYRFRREPNAQSLSTIESIVAALEILEPETADLDNPLAVFTHMVEKQCGFTEGTRPSLRIAKQNAR